MDIKWHFLIAFLLQISLVIYGYIHDAYFKVKFTDVDYVVFTDAATYVSKGLSPFKRHTYRYTPALAVLLLPNVLLNDAFGKIFFCFLNILTSLLMNLILKSQKFSPGLCRTSTFLWLYNPLIMVISARGNAESIMTFLLILCTYFYLNGNLHLSGFIYGLAIHFKIYPCIYALSFYFALSPVKKTARDKVEPRSKQPSDFLNSLSWLCIIVFFISSLFGFAIPSIIAYFCYGDDYVQEAFVYHLLRKDIRHNFSPYFYMLYLSESLNDQKLSIVLSYTGFFVQGALIALVSWVFRSVPISMFLQTFIFVSFNKVCTSQYFLWYLCFFPLIYPLLKVRLKSILFLFTVWCIGQVVWLIPAYYLEFKGVNVFGLVFISSLLYFIINICIADTLIRWISHSLSVTDQKKYI